MNSTEIKKQYVVNDKIFDNLQDAENYQDELKVKSLNDYPSSSFDEIVYYEIFTKLTQPRMPPISIGGGIGEQRGENKRIVFTLN